MKKLTALLLAALMLTAVLFGCAGGNITETDTEKTTEKTADT